VLIPLYAIGVFLSVTLSQAGMAHRWWHNFLHNQTAMILRLALLFRQGVVITDVPFLVD
jgi:hypothetical protein